MAPSDKAKVTPNHQQGLLEGGNKKLARMLNAAKGTTRNKSKAKCKIGPVAKSLHIR